MGILSKEELLRRAPSDIKDEVLDVPEWGDDAQVRVRGLTAGRRAAIDKVCIKFRQGSTDIANDQLAILQVEAGLVEPKLNAKEVKQFADSSGAGFERVHKRILAMSGIDKEEEADVTQRFPGVGDGPEPAPSQDGPGGEARPDAG